MSRYAVFLGIHLPIFLSLLLLSMALNTNGEEAAEIAIADSVGVNYGQTANNLPQPAVVAGVLQSMGIRRVRIPDADPDVLRAFSFTGISLMVDVPNGFIPRLASNRSESLRWVLKYVKPFFPAARISAISVGNEVLSLTPELAEFLVPAMQNLHLALRELGLGIITVSTTHSLDVLAGGSDAFPPSAARFRDAIAEAVMTPLLNFLDSVNGSFLVNLYPYLVYRSEPTIPLGFALFQDGPLNYRDDPNNGLRYTNLFDSLVDAVVTAMASLGHDLPVVVTETGWPSAGDANEPDANPDNAAIYIQSLAKHVLSKSKPGSGTPLRPQGPMETYIFALFDENMRSGPVSEQHWGILNPNLTMKYPLELSGSGRGRRSQASFQFYSLYLPVIYFALILWVFFS